MWLSGKRRHKAICLQQFTPRLGWNRVRGLGRLLASNVFEWAEKRGFKTEILDFSRDGA